MPLEPHPYSPDISEDVHSAKGERTRPLLAYWESLCAPGGLPTWDGFDLMELFRIAPYVAVLDVEGPEDEPKFRYRYIGTYLVQSRRGLKHSDPTGQLLDDVPRAYDYTPVLRTYAACVAKKTPFLVSGDFTTYLQYGYSERMIVPLSSNGVSVDKLVTCLDRLKEEDISPY